MCHEYGHLQYTCPKRTANKYPLMYCSSSVSEASVHDSVEEGDPILLSEPIRQFERSEEDNSPCVKGHLQNTGCLSLRLLSPLLISLSMVTCSLLSHYTRENTFLTLHEGKHFRNQRSAFVHSSFVSESVTDLLRDGCISMVEEKPLVCSPLLVVVI